MLHENCSKWNILNKLTFCCAVNLASSMSNAFRGLVLKCHLSRRKCKWVSWPAFSSVLEANESMLTSAPGHSYFEKDVNLVYILTLLPNKMNSWEKKKKPVLNTSEMSHHQFVTCSWTPAWYEFQSGRLAGGREWIQLSLSCLNIHRPIKTLTEHNYLFLFHLSFIPLVDTDTSLLVSHVCLIIQSL